MADFKTHITTSTVLGVGYGVAGYAYGMTWDSSLVAAGLCSVSGMLPDLDSDSGIPIRETISFSAAVVPMLMMDRFQELGLTHAQMAALGGVIYLTIRFGVAELFKRYTVHRGMWHSIPAACTATLLGFLVCSCHEFDVRIYKAAAVFIGFMTHLVLDELYSIDLKGRRIKKSFGTAIKFFSKSAWANVSTYAKLAIVAFLAFGDPMVMEKYGHHSPEVPQVARDWFSQVTDRLPSWSTGNDTEQPPSPLPSQDQILPNTTPPPNTGFVNRSDTGAPAQPQGGTFLR